MNTKKTSTLHGKSKIVWKQGYANTEDTQKMYHLIKSLRDGYMKDTCVGYVTNVEKFLKKMLKVTVQADINAHVQREMFQISELYAKIKDIPGDR